jgi:hypothetical protein
MVNTLKRIGELKNKKIIRGKKLRRNELSRLPFKDKIDILIHLQQMAKGIKKPGKEKNRVVWKI